MYFERRGELVDAKTLHEKLAKAMEEHLRDMPCAADPKAQAENNESSSTRVKSVEFADEWMTKLFDAYQEQKITDNKRIWEIGRIFVPISLSPFLLALDHSKNLRMLELWVCAGISVCLYLFWLLFAERHRDFQETGELAQIRIVQQMSQTSDMSLDRLTRLVVPRSEEKRSWYSLSVQLVRWIGFVFILGAWGAVLCTGSGLAVESERLKAKSQQSQEQRPAANGPSQSHSPPVTKPK
jgi:hypothetical protein